ncbi:MAG: glutathione S-transferase [Burkholderiales bacterium]|nr:glutathione S-transferase [Burkholderiales bacterium]
MTPIAVPLLYTFRRCPYAIRARLAILVSGVEVDACEVDLKNKPQEMLSLSPKGTVPVLQLADGRVIDESLDIMRWALSIHDPAGWMNSDAESAAEAMLLIDENDGSFKRLLDRYKYPGCGQPESLAHSREPYRDEAGRFLRTLSSRLAKHKFLMSESMSLADAAIVPFVRQFAQVDRAWFDATYGGPLAAWLESLVRSPLFENVMQKH